MPVGTGLRKAAGQRSVGDRGARHDLAAGPCGGRGPDTGLPRDVVTNSRAVEAYELVPRVA